MEYDSLTVLGRNPSREEGKKRRDSLALAGLKEVVSFKLKISRIGFPEQVDLHSETKV